ncbi:MAG TPA: 5-(carboxyamino)imidazole ribonucleotide synthase [archaeon]|nr:5-(carboxyamino)imidazole ribonucleotide synthase [archaeon]
MAEFISGSYPRIGVVGGGQLAKMLALEAKKMGLRVVFLDPAEKPPALTVSDKHIKADFSDEKALNELAKESDFITYELEWADAELLKKLELNGAKINPSSETLRIIQSKLSQRNFLKKNKLPVPSFYEINNLNELRKRFKEFNGKAMLKLSRGSYDGKGNIELNDEKKLDEIYEKVKGKEMFIEEWVDFEKELSVMVARNVSGEIKAYPVVENIHNESILDTTIVPAQISNELKEKAKEIAVKVLDKLKGAGVYGIELFLSRKKEILINEIAPRVHNSGHYTIEACKTSQFEQHLRAIMDLPLGSTELLSNAVMINILGTGKTGKFKFIGLKDLMKIDGANIHIYGKEESREKRKMGHVTILDLNIESALKKAEKAKKIIKMEGI